MLAPCYASYKIRTPTAQSLPLKAGNLAGVEMENKRRTKRHSIAPGGSSPKVGHALESSAAHDTASLSTYCFSRRIQSRNPRK